jgi:hypothetical protein
MQTLELCASWLVEYSEQACVFYDAISVPSVNKKIQFLLFWCSSGLIQRFSVIAQMETAKPAA